MTMHDGTVVPSSRGPGAGMLLIISGPSGVGKTTITHEVEKRVPGAIFSVSFTTRQPTIKDRPGIDYHFIEDSRFDQMIAESAFLEWAGVFGKRYGTPKQPVIDAMKGGKLMILEIDVQGAMTVKAQVPDALCMFVLPPSEEELLKRLRSRGREDEEKIQRRFGEARREIEISRNCGVYDVFVVNRQLESAVAQAVGLVQGELALRRALPAG